MSDSSIKNQQTHGFYYDVQMSNPLLTATLHTNTYISGVTAVTKEGDEAKEDYISWKDYLNSDTNINVNDINPYEFPCKFHWDLWKPLNDKEAKDKPAEGKVHCLDPITHNFSYAYDKNPSACYREKPLITSILSEDFQVDLANAWSDSGGATQIESIFNSLRQSAGSTKETGGLLTSLSDEIGKYITNKDGILGKGNNYLKKIGEAMKEGADTLNSALITQGTRFSYYGGTSTAFGNLNMRFTLFADWVYSGIGKKWVFRTVHDQLREIYPYAVGKYYPLDLDLRSKAPDGSWIKKPAEAADKAISSFFGWQQPPAGFQTDIRSLDTCQKGTLRLVLGGYYTAENLVISGMSVNFSKTMTKIPPNISTYDVNDAGADSRAYYGDDKATGDKMGLYKGKTQTTTRVLGNSKEGELTPLYADVTITLRPASSYSDNAIINFSSNKGRGKFDYSMAQMRNSQLQKEIQRKKTFEKTTTPPPNQNQAGTGIFYIKTGPLGEDSDGETGDNNLGRPYYH